MCNRRECEKRIKGALQIFWLSSSYGALEESKPRSWCLPNSFSWWCNHGSGWLPPECQSQGFQDRAAISVRLPFTSPADPAAAGPAGCLARWGRPAATTTARRTSEYGDLLAEWWAALYVEPERLFADFHSGRSSRQCLARSV